MIPGIWWRHERPHKYPQVLKSLQRIDAATAARIEEAERPPKWYPMAPERPLVPASDISCPEGSYRGVSGNLISETAAFSRTSVGSEDEANNSTKPDPPAKQSTADGVDSSLNNGRTRTQKSHSREAGKATSEILTNDRNSAPKKGKDRGSFRASKKQQRANRIISSRPRRAAAAAALEKMANAT